VFYKRTRIIAIRNTYSFTTAVVTWLCHGDFVVVMKWFDCAKIWRIVGTRQCSRRWNIGAPCFRRVNDIPTFVKTECYPPFYTSTGRKITYAWLIPLRLRKVNGKRCSLASLQRGYLSNGSLPGSLASLQRGVSRLFTEVISLLGLLYGYYYDNKFCKCMCGSISLISYPEVSLDFLQRW